MGAGHPEQPDRLRAIERSLDGERFHALTRREAPAAARETLLLVHPEHYLDMLERESPQTGHVLIGVDNAMCPATMEAALHAAGGAVAAVDEVMAKTCDNAFVAVRPPGHHASAANPMGFCFLNNVAVAARHARAAYGVERVAIVDFDVHHGNGTQDIFWADENTLFCSVHQAPFYPGTGDRDETGEHGNIVNAPLRAGSTGDAFRYAFSETVLPRVQGFAPDVIFISAGFDAHECDPLGGLRVTEEDFSEVTKRLMDVADRRCGGRIVSLLEGGYDLDALGRSVSAHVQALMGF